MTTETHYDYNTGKTVTNTYESEDSAPMQESFFGFHNYDEQGPQGGLFGRLGSFLFGEPEPHPYHEESFHLDHPQRHFSSTHDNFFDS